MLYAQTIRESLADSKVAGLTFGVAWDKALTDNPPPDPAWKRAITATKIRQAFRDAYYQKAPKRILHLVKPDRAPIVEREESKPVATAPKNHGLCMSGDGCGRKAVIGRHGPTFCEIHGEELERLHLDAPKPYRIYGTKAA